MNYTEPHIFLISTLEAKGIEGLLARIKGVVKMRTRFNGIREYYYCLPLADFIGDDDEEDEQPEF